MKRLHIFCLVLCAIVVVQMFIICELKYLADDWKKTSHEWRSLATNAIAYLKQTNDQK